MRVGIETWGSDGDIRPFFALGGGLAARGHEVTIVTGSVDDKDYAGLAAALGVKYVKFADKVNLDFGSFRERFYRTGNSIKLLKELLDAGFFPYVERLSELAKTLCETSDVTVGHFFMYPLRAAALKSKTPYATVTLCHGIVPAGHRPPMRMPNLGRVLNRLAWALVARIVDRALKKEVARFWEDEGLPPFRHVVSGAMTSEALNILAVSEVFCGPWPEEGGRHKVAGYFGMPAQAEKWSASKPLEEFLAGGEAPVYMTFGSAGQIVADEGTQLMIAAAEIAGCRAIVQSLSPRYPPGIREGNCYFIGPTPHERIFGSCAAVVHHGGAGTTHTAARAGRPTVVVYFSDEQMFWGRECERLGIAPAPMAFKKATPGKLARAIRCVLDAPETGRRAEEVGERMRREDGVGTAVRLIEELAGTARAGGPGERNPRSGQ